MNMYTGEAVYPDNDGVPTLFSIGVGEGRIARFCGQTKKLYTVLPHSLVVASIMEPEHAIHGLLHDSPEVCHADVPTPWKSSTARKSEKRLLKRIYLAYDLKWPMSPDALAAVEHADAVALAAEANVLGHSAAKQVWPIYDEKAAKLTRQHLKLVPQYLEPAYAAAAFMDAFERHMEQYKNTALIAA